MEPSTRTGPKLSELLPSSYASQFITVLIRAYMPILTSHFPKFTLLDEFRKYDALQKLRNNAFSVEAPEKLHLQSLLFSVAVESKRYKTEIAHLHAKIFALRTEYDELKEHVELSQSLLAPVRKLSDEILGEIFQRLRLRGDKSVPEYNVDRLVMSLHRSALRLDIPFLNSGPEPLLKP